MLNVTYLGHSGFLVETDKAYYLFDYIRGSLPEFMPEKPLYVFASHFHGDHFDKIIFEEPIGDAAAGYWLGRDIYRHNKRRVETWPEGLVSKVTWVLPKAEFEAPGVKITTLRSTDSGVAFVVREEGGPSIYHAGDLNWWYWEEESKAWNNNIEKTYKREIDSMRGETIDVAFVPLDPRLEDSYWFGLSYFEETVNARHIFPMHFWEDYGVIERYIKEHHNAHNSKATIHVLTEEDELHEI